MQPKNPAAVALGSIRSEKKAASSRKNGLDQRPHIVKTNHFISVYPHPLVSVEFKVKWPMQIGEKKTTYNPDFFSPEEDCYIEVSTSVPNISEQSPKWTEAISLGHKLRVFWWEGEEITNRFS
jgi:hypothetical protein